VEINPADPDGHYNLGVCLVNLGNGEEALAQFQKAVELKPDYAEAYFQLGSLYISQNKTQEAISSLEKFCSWPLRVIRLLWPDSCWTF